MVRNNQISIFRSPLEANQTLALEVACLIGRINQSGRDAVLGLATGSSPIGLYNELVRLHQSEGLSFARVITFNLDEYSGLDGSQPESYASFMKKHLFDRIDIAPQNTHLPSGTASNTDALCADYERLIQASGGIDFQLVGIGRIGHIGFNEPGSARDSRTRPVTLAQLTREDAAKAFGGIEHVPATAVTMGCGTILDARRIAFVAFGEHKAKIVQQAIEGEVTNQVTASYLQTHPNVHFFLDEAAASLLDPETRKQRLV